MSVLIKGMEMPASCCQCPVNIYLCKRGYEYLLEHPTLYDERAKDCPLVPVPPHGDLIDKQVADELNKKDYEEIGSAKYTDYARGVVLNCLNAAPIIIPAEESET